MKQNRGFTLIELMIVMAIIAILAAVLIPALSRAKLAAEIAELMPGFSVTNRTITQISKLKSGGMSTEEALNQIFLKTLLPEPTQQPKLTPPEFSESNFESVDEVGDEKKVSGIIVHTTTVSFTGTIDPYGSGVDITEYWFRVMSSNDQAVWVQIDRQIYDENWKGKIYKGQ